jgi:hypothetical protein
MAALREFVLEEFREVEPLELPEHTSFCMQETPDRRLRIRSFQCQGIDGKDEPCP